MSSEQHGREAESLGQFLKRTRTEQGYELQYICEETRISNSNLKAMEADDFGALPADAFTRGFYAIYARLLKLDPDEIVARFKAERGVNHRKNVTNSYHPPHIAAQQVSNMAEPSMGSPLSTIGYILLLLIILSGGICWYFNINPATFLSEKLRGFQDEATQEITPGDVDKEKNQPPSADSKSQGAYSTPFDLPSLNLARNSEIFSAAKMTTPIVLGKNTCEPGIACVS